MTIVSLFLLIHNIDFSRNNKSIFYIDFYKSSVTNYRRLCSLFVYLCSVSGRRLENYQNHFLIPGGRYNLKYSLRLHERLCKYLFTFLSQKLSLCLEVYLNYFLFREEMTHLSIDDISFRITYFVNRSLREIR